MPPIEILWKIHQIDMFELLQSDKVIVADRCKSKCQRIPMECSSLTIPLLLDLVTCPNGGMFFIESWKWNWGQSHFQEKDKKTKFQSILQGKSDTNNARADDGMTYIQLDFHFTLAPTCSHHEIPSPSLALSKERELFTVRTAIRNGTPASGFPSTFP